MEKKNNSKYSKGLVRGSFGVLLFLLCALIALSPSTHLHFLSYPLIASLGYVGYYGLLLLGAFFGAVLPFWGKIHHPKARNYVAYGLLLLGGIVLASDLGNGGKENPFDASSFLQSLTKGYQSKDLSLLLDPKLCGGIAGYELAGLLNLAGRYLVILVASLILAASLLVFFFPLIKKARLALRAHQAIKKAQKKQKRAEISDSISVGEADPDFAYHKKEIATSTEEEKEEILKQEKKSFDAWSFKPSSSLAYSSRSELHRSEEASSAQEATSPILRPSEIAMNTSYRGDEIQEPIFDFLQANQGSVNKEREVTPMKNEEKKPERSPEEKSFDFAPGSIGCSSPESVEIVSAESGPFPQEEPLQEEPLLQEEPEPSFAPDPLPGVSEASAFSAPSKSEEPESEPSPSPDASLAPSAQPCEVMKQEAPANKEDLPAIKLPHYVFPDISMLDEPKNDAESMALATAQAEKDVQVMNETLASLHAGARIVSYKIGPSVTRFDVELDSGVQVTSITRFEPDISRCLAGRPARFVPIVQGKTTSAFEIGNIQRMPVCFKEVFEALPNGPEDNMVVPFGKSIDGNVVYADLSSFPHMLVAGTTGSGKSIFIHSMLLTLLMRNRPEDLKLIMVDPKQVEFTAYDDMPNLLCPTIVSAEKANVAFQKLADLMDRRFELLRKARVRDIRSYNSFYAPKNNKRKLPFIVVVVDEFADLAGQCKDVSEPIQRLGQKGRACGIHMIIATQRPDANTISGTIKSNLPTTVCLMVKNSIDSNVVLHAKGGESLLDHGDMLIECPKLGRGLIRAQGAMIGEHTELERIPDFIRSQMKPIYDPEFLNLEPEQQTDAAALVEMPSSAEMKGMADEEKYQTIKSVIMTQETTSISQIQRNFGVGFPRAGKIIARLQNEGIVAKVSDAPGSSKGLRVLVRMNLNEGGVPNGETPGSLSSANVSYTED